MEIWRRGYDEERTHSFIGDVTSMEVIHHHHIQPQTVQASTPLAVM